MDQSWFLYRVSSVCDVLVVVGFRLKHVLAFVLFYCFFFIWSSRHSWCSLTLAIKCCACVACLYFFPKKLYCGLNCGVYWSVPAFFAPLCLSFRGLSLCVVHRVSRTLNTLKSAVASKEKIKNTLLQFQCEITTKPIFST